MEWEQERRVALLDFLRGVMQLDPSARWTPRQAAQHPFVTGVPFDVARFNPPPEPGQVAPQAPQDLLGAMASNNHGAMGLQGGTMQGAPMPIPIPVPRSAPSGPVAMSPYASPSANAPVYMHMSPPGAGSGFVPMMPQMMPSPALPQASMYAMAAAVNGGLQQQLQQQQLQLANASTLAYGLGVSPEQMAAGSIGAARQLLAFQQQQLQLQGTVSASVSGSVVDTCFQGFLLISSCFLSMVATLWHGVAPVGARKDILKFSKMLSVETLRVTV